MNKKLSDISSIQFGPYEKASDTGEAKYLLASHFDSRFQPSRFELSYVNLDENMGDSLLKKNDVILAGKGQRTFAWAYDEKLGLCVPSSIFFVIETDENIILGEYLAHFLNTDLVQHQLKLLGAGGTIPSIPKKELGRLLIWVPSMEAQVKIVAMANLLEDDWRLTQNLLLKKELMQKMIMHKMIYEPFKYSLT